MTREEAIEYLEDAKYDLPYKFEQALNMAIKALAERPTESDFISKAKVLETYSELYWFDIDCGVVSKAEVDKIYERLQSLPSADRTEPGRWEIKTETDEYGLKRPKLVCSKCEKEPAAWDLTELFEFCPNCGAKMFGEGGEA